MRILPEPARFKKHEYKKFLRDYPHAKEVLKNDFIDEDGQKISLANETGQEVHVYVGLLNEEQRKGLGNAALRDLERRLIKPRKIWPMALIGSIIAIAVIIFLWNMAPQQDHAAREPDNDSTLETVDSGETSDEAESEETEIATVLPTPTAAPTEPAESAPAPAAPQVAPPKIETVALKDEEGFYITPDDNKYFVDPGEQVLLEINEGSQLGSEYRIECAAIRGDVQRNNRYVAPNQAGTTDPVTIKIVDAATGEIVAQTAIVVKTFGSR